VNLAALDALFHKVHAALRPGGLFIFDVATPGRAHGARRGFEGRDWAIIVNDHENAERGELTREITTFRRSGRAYRRTREAHVLRLYEPAEILRRLRAAGFRVRTTRAYGRRPFPRGLVGFVARRTTT